MARVQIVTIERASSDDSVMVEPAVSLERLNPEARRQALRSFPGLDTLREEVTAVLDRAIRVPG